MKRLWRWLFAVVLMPPCLTAMVDTNDNGVSDFWEKNFNEGELFSAAFDPQADPVSDGWTNAQEAAAGTNPFDANPPDGIVRPKIAHLPAVIEETGSGQQVIIPEAVTLTWPTINGKLYTLLFSPDLTAESWLPIDNSFMGNGNEVTYGFEIMAANARFWRIKVEDIDSDRDGFTNAEEYLLGTNPFAMDTDGDGVSDWQESMIQGTDPLSAADHDEDGIPDDLERHLASQLLAMCPDPAAWGAKFHGLLSGDLDPEHDYTDEGMSAAELAELLIPVARAPHGTEYLVQSMIRRNSIPAAYHIFAQENKPESNQGQYRYSIPGDWDGGYALSSKSDFTSGYLLTQIATLAWSNYSSPSLVPWSNVHARDRSEAVSGFMQQPLAHPLGTEYRGYIRQNKFRLVAARADHAGLSETYLKITSKREYAGMGLGEVLSAEAVTLSIPRGKFSSEWFEFAAPMVDGQDTLMLLLPVELLTDIDNDGEIGGADSGLAQKALESGATEEDIDKGTEFLFTNDQLSNGLWDGEDSDPDKPAAEKDDDDAQQIKIDPGITEGEVWLEHPAIAGLSFYKTRECKAGDKMNLSPSSKFTVSKQNPFPEEIFIRADGNIAFPPADPQVAGDLVLKIKVADQEIEATKIKLTVVKELGAKKYFHAARDYILEENTRFHVKDAEYEDDRFGWADSHFRVVSMRESATTLYPIDASRRTGGIPLRGIDAIAGAFPGISVAINGNISYFSGSSSSLHDDFGSFLR